MQLLHLDTKKTILKKYGRKRRKTFEEVVRFI